MDAGLSYTVLFYLGLIGKIASGFLADRLGRKRVFSSTIAIMASGAALLTLPSYKLPRQEPIVNNGATPTHRTASASFAA